MLSVQTLLEVPSESSDSWECFETTASEQQIPLAEILKTVVSLSWCQKLHQTAANCCCSPRLAWCQPCPATHTHTHRAAAAGYGCGDASRLSVEQQRWTEGRLLTTCHQKLRSDKLTSLLSFSKCPPVEFHLVRSDWTEDTHLCSWHAQH